MGANWSAADLAKRQAAPPAPKPCRFAATPAALEAGRTRVMLDLPDADWPALLHFLTQTLKAQRYT